MMDAILDPQCRKRWGGML